MQQKWLKWLVSVFLASSSLYLLSRIYAFASFLGNEAEIEKDKHFEFAYQIHILNIVHAICFALLACLLFKMVKTSYLIFKQEHYGRMFNFVTLAVTLYFVPLVGIFALSFYHGDDQRKDETEDAGPSSSVLFINWVVECLISEKGGVPLMVTVVLHLQLLFLIGAMLFISEDLLSNMEKLAQIRQAAKQDHYDALELNSVLPTELTL